MQPKHYLLWALALCLSFSHATKAQNWSPVVGTSDLNSLGITSITDLHSIGDRIFISGLKADFTTGLFYSDDEGETWDAAAFDAPTVGFNRLSQEGDTVYAFGFDIFGNRAVRRTVDNGANWSSVYSTISGLGFAFVAEHMARLDQHLIMANANSATGVFRSSDGGASWTAFNTFDIPDNIEFEGLYVRDNYFYMMAEEGGFRMYRSHKDSTSWELYQTHDFPDVTSNNNLLDDIYAAVTLPSGRLVLVTTSGIRYSDDNGVNWELVLPSALGLTSAGVPWGVQHVANEVMIGFIGTTAESNNIWLLDDNITQTTDVTAGLDTYDNSNRFILLASTSTGVFARLQNETTTLYRYGSGVATSLFDELGASAGGQSSNHPNPFQESTTIVFDLEQAGTIELAVLNMAGEVVATVATGYWGSGAHQVSFDASDLPGGVYWCRLLTEIGQTMNKMVYDPGR